MAQPGDSVCGIDITKENISVARFSVSENTVANASIIINPIDDADSTVDLFSSLKAKFRKVAAQMRCEGLAAVVSVPAHYAVVKKVMLDADEQDVRGAIGWDLSQHIIGTLDDYVYDFEALAGGDGKCSRYLAVAYKNANVQKLISLLKTGKLSPLVVDLDIFALIDLFEANYPEDKSAPTVIIHGNDDYSKLALTANGMFLDFEVAEHFGGQVSSDSYALQVREAMARCFPGAPPVFVTGPLFADLDFSESVLSRLGNARALDPFKTIRSTADIPKNDLAKCNPYLAVAVGLALRGAAEAGA
jgi:Tfp pilus assembly PilM family ATPase